MKAIAIIIVSVVCSLSYSQQLYRQTFSSGFATTQYGISMPGEAFNQTHTAGNLVVKESILQLLTANHTLSNNSPLDNKIIKIYPNPVTNVLYISGENSLELDLVIYDNIGKQIYKSKPSMQGVNLGHLSSGLYHLVLFDNNKIVHRQKIIKQ